MTRDAPQPHVDLDAVARLVVEAHDASPCATVAAALRDGHRVYVGVGAAGHLDRASGSPRAHAHTPFDLASVTKPFTALAFARLVRAGALGLEQPLAELVPALARTPSGSVPLGLFAAHRSGLDGHRPLYAPLVDGHPVNRDEAILVAAAARRAECGGTPPEEGFAPVYSDLGYLLLGLAMERASGLDLDALLAREVTEPLGLRVGSARQLTSRDPRFGVEVAPTEVVAFRGGTVRGVVHDENAWALVGDACAGHAGLFGDAAAVLGLGLALLDVLAGRRADWLRAQDLEPLLRTRPGGSLLAGFDRRSGATPSSGRHFGERTFGHLGFTGTSVWIDPDAEIVGVLLTNRVHPTRAADAIRRARPAAYDLLFERMTHAARGSGKETSP